MCISVWCLNQRPWMTFKRHYAVVYRLYLCPSVTLVDCDHIHYDSWKVISQINRLILILLEDPNIAENSNGKCQIWDKLKWSI